MKLQINFYWHPAFLSIIRHISLEWFTIIFHCWCYMYLMKQIAALWQMRSINMIAWMKISFAFLFLCILDYIYWFLGYFNHVHLLTIQHKWWNWRYIITVYIYCYSTIVINIDIFNSFTFWFVELICNLHIWKLLIGYGSHSISKVFLSNSSSN